MLKWHMGDGVYYVKGISHLDELVQSLDNKLQTLAVWQVPRQDLLKLVENPSINGLDRVVPVGQALDFHPNWDGYDLMSQLSRKIQFTI